MMRNAGRLARKNKRGRGLLASELSNGGQNVYLTRRLVNKKLSGRGSVLKSVFIILEEREFAAHTDARQSM